MWLFMVVSKKHQSLLHFCSFDVVFKQKGSSLPNQILAPAYHPNNLHSTLSTASAKQLHPLVFPVKHTNKGFKCDICFTSFNHHIHIFYCTFCVVKLKSLFGLQRNSPSWETLPLQTCHFIS